RLLLASPREAGAHRGAGRGGLAGRGRRVLGHAAAGEPARGARLRAERRAREPPRPHRALDGASPPLPPAAGPAAPDLDGLPPRPRVDRVLDAPGAPPARARALRADAGGVAAAAPPAVTCTLETCRSRRRLIARLD